MASTMRCVLSFFLVPLLLGSFIEVAADEDDQCGLYMAISSTSTGDDKVKWGVYAGRSYSKDDPIGNGEIAINAIHLRANNIVDPNGEEFDAEYQDHLMKGLEFLEESFWVPDATGGRFELDHGRVIAAVTGIGSLGAFNSKLTNADWNHQTPYHRQAMGEEAGVAYPNRGAISSFYNVQMMALDDIKPGAEIFVNYGTNWGDEELKDELVKPDYAKIDETIEQMVAFFEKHKAEMDTDSKQEVYDFITKDVMTAAIGPAKARKVAQLLPPRPDDLSSVITAGGSLVYSQPASNRPVSWLAEHGRCMDQIKVGASTIPNAGRGAFATRKIPKGGLISAMPLLHIPDRAVLEMYDVDVSDTGDFARSNDEVRGEQLIVNYCFGHPESTMLLFPTGSNAVFINHADEPNTKLVWSGHPSHQKIWLQSDPADLLLPANKYLGLIMEAVATRDIEKGEEVFLDYGEEWKAAYAAHVASWAERVSAGDIPVKWPDRAIDLNKKYADKPLVPGNPYDDNVSLNCFIMLAESEATGSEKDPKTWSDPPEGTYFLAEHLFETVVVSRTEVANAVAPYNYTIRWTNNRGDNTYVKDVPHSAFVFVDKAETGDQFTDEPFRHYIGIPDDIFPQGAWRNAEK